MDMQILSSAQALADCCRSWHKEGKTIALVPTMGYYHEGHMSLMDKARTLADKVVVSLFVNPTQFGPNEDYASYPRDMERDAAIAREHGADLLFTPTPDELYAPDAGTWVEVPEMGQLLCGISRPIHFRGVCTVCTKLFLLSQADYAVFGNKDWQQQAIIRRMVRDMNVPVRIETQPTMREADGLAMSSRNVYMTEAERAQAPQLRQGLELARRLAAQGETSAALLRDAVLRYWAEHLPLGRLDYLSVVDADSLEPLDTLNGRGLMACAVHMGKARLIDNILLQD